MSWASNDPEKYDEIVRKGLVNYLDERMTNNGFAVPGDWLEGYRALIETMQVDLQLKGLYTELSRLASTSVLEAEKDYFGSKGDYHREGG